MRTAFTVLVTVAMTVARCGPPNGPPPGPDSGDACASECDAGIDSGLDASDADTGFDADAAPSGWGFDRDAWVAPRQPCDATQLKLSPTGGTGSFHSYERLAVYDDRRFEGFSRDVFIFDLATCFELSITSISLWQSTPFIWEHTVTFAAVRTGDVENRLFSMDLDSGDFRELPSAFYGAFPRNNGRYILYDSYIDSPINGSALTLWDTWNGDEVNLAEDWQGAEYPSLSPTHAAWVAAGGPGKDVYYADLETKTVIRIESTIDPEVWYATTWGDWLLWEDRRNGDADVYAMRLSTGEETRVTDNGAWNGMPQLKKGIACYRTTQWNTTGFDLAILEVDTGVTRRVPLAPDPGYKCGLVDGGWLVYQNQVGTHVENEIYAINLIAAGILDDQGEHVLPE